MANSFRSHRRRWGAPCQPEGPKRYGALLLDRALSTATGRSSRSTDRHRQFPVGPEACVEVRGIVVTVTRPGVPGAPGVRHLCGQEITLVCDDREPQEAYGSSVGQGIAVMRSVRNLKRDLLLFDKIHVMGLRWQIGGDVATSGLPTLDDSVAADCDYLVDAGVLQHAPAFREDLADYVFDCLGQSAPDWPEDTVEWDGHSPLSSLPPVTQAAILGSTARHPAGVLPWERALPPGSEIVVAHAESLLNPAGAVAVLERPVRKEDWQQLTRTFLLATSTEADRDAIVAEVVLPHIPVPGDDVSIEALLDFRREPVTVQKIEGLRLWMKRAALGTASTADLELDIQTMLHDYRRHMAVADMRATDGVLQLAISIPLGIAEELIHLRPKAAFDAVFAFRQSRAERLEAELKAPGQEIAYLHTASRRFT